MSRAGFRFFYLVVFSFFFGVAFSMFPLKAEEADYDALDAEMQEMEKAKDALRSMGSDASDSTGWSKGKFIVDKDNIAEAFVAGSDWEFDGFVAGGQDARIKTMFILGDLIYLNIGHEQGIEPGNRISVYRRGDQVRDPQTGKLIGYEVRRGAIAKVTDKVEGEFSVARIIKTYEGIEIGDLVRKND